MIGTVMQQYLGKQHGEPERLPRIRYKDYLEGLDLALANVNSVLANPLTREDVYNLFLPPEQAAQVRAAGFPALDTLPAGGIKPGEMVLCSMGHRSGRTAMRRMLEEALTTRPPPEAIPIGRVNKSDLTGHRECMEIMLDGKRIPTRLRYTP